MSRKNRQVVSEAMAGKLSAIGTGANVAIDAVENGIFFLRCGAGGKKLSIVGECLFLSSNARAGTADDQAVVGTCDWKRRVRILFHERVENVRGCFDVGDGGNGRAYFSTRVVSVYQEAMVAKRSTGSAINGTVMPGVRSVVM